VEAAVDTQVAGAMRLVVPRLPRPVTLTLLRLRPELVVSALSVIRTALDLPPLRSPTRMTARPPDMVNGLLVRTMENPDGMG
jgi:hypothetical protein